MTVLAPERHRWTSGWRPILVALLALATVVPLATLFVGHARDHLGTGRSFATQERDGIEYLLALSQVSVALTDAQAAAVRGEQVPGEALTRAMDATAELDRRHGEELRVRERWAQLRDTIEQVTGAGHADPRAAYAGYEEATGLLLDLHQKLRETTGLIRDADADTYYLQDAAAEELPEAMVAAAQLIDLVTIADAESASDQAANAAEVSVARVAVAGPADDLAVDLQSALDSTESRTLSSNVLSKLDRFLQAKDELLGTVPPDGDVADVNVEGLASLRTELQAAASDLVTALLVEMDALVEDRAGALARQQAIAIAALVAGVLLALALAALSLNGLRRPARGGTVTAGVATAGRPPSEPGGGLAGHQPPAADPFPVELVGSERSDAR